MALADHPAGDIFTADPHSGNGTAIVVMAPDSQDDRLVHHPAGQGRTRGLTAGLANLRRINAVDADWNRFAASGEPNPERVAVGDMCHFSALCPYRSSASSY